MIKKIGLFLLLFFPWFISGLFVRDYGFYSNLNLPSFALPSNLFFIVWTILYILISISEFIIFSKYYLRYETDYKKALILNYIFNQLFIIVFFLFKSPFLGFIDCVIILITSLFLYYETKSLNKKAGYFLLPYVFFSLYASILSLTVYLINL